MAKAKIVICGDEDVAKAMVDALKKPAGGGYKTVDGPFETDVVMLETVGVMNVTLNNYVGDTDLKTWFVVARA